MDKMCSNKKYLVEVEWSLPLLFFMISKLILLRPNWAITHCRHKSGGIETIRLALAGRQPSAWDESDSRLVTLRPTPYQQQLPMRHCSRLPLKPTPWFLPADDAGILPAADDAGTLPASQLKSPFQGYSKSLFKHLLRRHNATVPTTSLSI